MGNKNIKGSKKSKNVKDDYQLKEQSKSFKIVIVGDNFVGKTQLVSRYVNNEFFHEYVRTLGVDVFKKNHVSGIKLQLWDISGSPRHIKALQEYAYDGSCFVIVYDITDKQSFDNVQMWIKFLDEIQDAQIFIVGNKCDLLERQVVLEEAKNKYSEYFICETSAHSNKNVNLLFETIISKLY